MGRDDGGVASERGGVGVLDTVESEGPGGGGPPGGMRPPHEALESASALRAWLQGAEAAQAAARGRRSAETEAALRDRLSELDAALKALGEVGESLEAAKVLGRGARGAGRKLKEECEGIAGERDGAAALARELAKRLRGHDDLTAAAAEVAQAESAPESARPEGTLTCLRALGECEAWADANSGHSGAARYTARLRSLTSRALTVSRKRCEYLMNSADKAAGSPSGGAAGGGGSISEWQAVLGAGGWRELCAGLAELSSSSSAAASEGGLLPSGQGAVDVAGVSSHHSASGSMSALCSKSLGELEELYGQMRAQRIFPSLQESMQKAVESLSLSEAASKCFELAESALSREEAAALGLFPSKASAESAVSHAAGPLGGVIFDCLRPYYIMEGRVDSLADLADAIGEILLLYGKDSGAGGEGVARGLGEVALAPFVASVLADVRQRLVYRTQAFVRDDIALFKHTDDDLDYPGVLESENRGTDDPGQDGRHMYLPLSQTLFVLKRLYTAVDRRTFGGIAQEAIKVCSDQLHIAAGLIVKRSSVLDGHLFLVRNLLVLRESVAQYSEADFSVVENELDFTHMRDHMGRIMRGEASVFQLGSSNAVLMLATDGRPRVNRMQSDARRELERNLKSACEAFILAVTKATVEPMLGFITKVTAVAVSGSVQPLKEHAFAALPRVAEIVEKVNEAIGDILPKASAKLSLYVSKPGLKDVLFGPIKSNIVEAHAQLVALLEREYPDEDRSVVKLKDITELRKLLDTYS